MEPEGFEPSSSRCSLGFCVSNLPNPHGCNRRTHAAAPRRLYRPSRYSLWMETAGVEPASSSVQARCSAGRASSPGVAMRTGGVEPPQPEAAGLQPVELSRAQRPRDMGRPTGLEPVPRASQTRVLRYTTVTMYGDDRTRTGGLSPDKRALCSTELRPHG